MKLSKSFQGVLIGSAFLLATDAFAANKGTLHVSSPEIVAGGTTGGGGLHRPLGWYRTQHTIKDYARSKSGGRGARQACSLG